MPHFFPKCMTTTSTNVVGHDYKRFYDFFWSQQPKRRRLPDVKTNLRTSWTTLLSLYLSLSMQKKCLRKRNWVVNKIKAHFLPLNLFVSSKNDVIQKVSNFNNLKWNELRTTQVLFSKISQPFFMYFFDSPDVLIFFWLRHNFPHFFNKFSLGTLQSSNDVAWYAASLRCYRAIVLQWYSLSSISDLTRSQCFDPHLS